MLKNEEKVVYSKSNPYGGRDRWINRDLKGWLRMPEGQKVLREATKEMVSAAEILKRHLGWEKADVYIAHQANERILAAVEKKVSGEGSIVYRTIAEHGNISSATCFYALDKAIREGVITEGGKVILTAFGGGLVTSAAAIQF